MQNRNWKAFFLRSALPCLLAVAAGFAAWLQVSLAIMTPAAALAAQWPVYAPLNALTAFCVTLLFFALLGRWSRATVLSGGLFTVLAIANYYTYDLHGTPLVPQDLLNAATAANVLGSYRLFLSKRVVMIAALYAPVLLLAWLQARLQPSGAARRLPRWAGSLAAGAAILYVGYLSPFPLKPMSGEICDRRHVYNEYGYFACTVEAFQTCFHPVLKPEGYSDEGAAQAAAQAAYLRAVPEAAPADYPDIVLILSESFYDFSLVTDLQADADPLAVLHSLPNSIAGYAVSPSLGGGTNQSEYELLTSNSLSLLPGVTPFNSLALGGSHSLCSYLQSLGYTALAAHPAPSYNYRRGASWSDLGFDITCFLPDFATAEYYGLRTDYRTDHALYQDFIPLYEAMPEDRPRFSFLLTIQTHGSYDLNPPEYDTIHAGTDYGAYNDQMDEYLSCLALSDQAFGELCGYFSQLYEETGRRVIVAMVGDHAPSFVTAVADQTLADEESLALLERCTPFVIWANYPLAQAGYANPQDPLNRMDLCMLTPALLEQAGLPLSPYYSYLLAMRGEAAAFTNLASYLAADGLLHPLEAGSSADGWVRGYYALEYNNIGSGAHRDDAYFIPQPAL